MYNFTENNRNQFMTEGAELLNHYGHETAYNGLEAIWSTYAINKANVAETLAKHPNWDPETLCVRLTEEYSTSVNRSAIDEFVRFLERRLAQWCREHEAVIAGMTFNEVRSARRRLYQAINALDNIAYRPVIMGGMTEDELRREYCRIDKIDDQFYNTYALYDARMTEENYNKANALRTIINALSNFTDNTLNEEMAGVFNNYAPIFFPVDEEGKKINKARFSKGQKTSKAVSKFFSLMDDYFVKYKDIQDEVWFDQSGNVHTRQKDKGWNYHFSAYADGINPIKVKRYTFISINPLDYLTMSFGNGWSSCHTIDHNNNRSNNGGHTYQGCYQSGTLSYMLDGSSIVMYTTKDDIDVTRPWEADKLNRCMFHLGEEKFVQGRTYPDGRDNKNDEEAVTIASSFRNIFQRVISECWDVSNLWIIKRNNDDYTMSYGTHYRDYLCYSDTCTSLLKGSTNTTAVRIGHNPICPVCGEEHSNEESLHCGNDHMCSHDENHVECARCGTILRIEDAFRDEDTGSYYCDCDCANNDGVYYCENVGEWHSVDVFYDDYTDEYFYDPDEERIEIECFCFQNEENANEYGYFQDEDGNWTRE